MMLLKMGNSGEPLLLGVIIGIHGLRGDLKIRALSPDASLLLELRRVLVRQADKVEVRETVGQTIRHKGNFLLRLAGVENAENLVGAEVLAVAEDLPPLSAGTWYWFQLQGMTAVDRQLGELGTLDDLFTTAAHDIYIVHGPYGEVMIPAVPQFIVEVDEAKGRILFDLPEGLVSKTDDL
jgi:16S rRNA processing protein RimM